MKHWEYCLLKFIMFYIMMSGYTTIYIDFKRLLIKSSKFIKISTFMYNLLFILTTPSAIQINFSHVVLNTDNPVIGYANAGIIVARLVSMLVVIIMRPNRNRQLRKWLEKVLAVQSSYFNRFSQVPRDTKLRMWLYFNIFLTLFHNLNILVLVGQWLVAGKWRSIYDIYIFSGIIVLQHSIMLHHAMLLCYLHECFSVLNYQLLNNDFNKDLSKTYFDLCALWQQLNVIFSPVNFWLQLCLLITNSMVGFVGILNLISSNLDFKLYTYLLGSSLYILICFHMHVYFMICDRSL